MKTHKKIMFFTFIIILFQSLFLTQSLATNYTYDISGAQTWITPGTTSTSDLQNVTVRAYVAWSNTLNYRTISLYGHTTTSWANSLGDTVWTKYQIYWAWNSAFVNPFDSIKRYVSYVLWEWGNNFETSKYSKISNR